MSTSSPPKTETAPKPPATSGRRPIRVAGQAARPAPTPVPRKLYECGTLDGCPRQNVNVAGVTFAAFRGTPTIHADGKVTGQTGRGHRQRLTDAHLARVLEEIGHRVVRLQANGRGDIYDDRARNYTAAEGDRRLAEFLFIEEITDEGQVAEAAAPSALAG